MCNDEVVAIHPILCGREICNEGRFNCFKNKAMKPRGLESLPNCWNTHGKEYRDSNANQFLMRFLGTEAKSESDSPHNASLPILFVPLLFSCPGNTATTVMNKDNFIRFNYTKNGKALLM